MTPEMATFLEKLRKTVDTALVGGSNLDKQIFQTGEDGAPSLSLCNGTQHKERRELL